MRKTVRFLLIFPAFWGMANLAFAQGVGPEFAPTGPVVQTSSSFMSLPSVFTSVLQEAFSLGSIDMRAGLRIGYQNIGLNFSLPAFSQIDHLPAPLDLSLKDANMWVGAVRLDAELWRRWFLFVSGEGNARQNATLFTYDEPTQYYGLTTFVPYKWTGTQLEWWSVDGGIGYRFCPGVALVAGSRWDRLSLVPSDPTDAAGNPVNVDNALGCPNCRLNERAYSEIWATTWIPYLGVEFAGRCFRSSLLWSPFGNAAIRVPLRFTRLIIIPVDPVFPRNTNVEYAFKLRRPGGFLEANFDYQATFSRTLGLGVWFKGTWLRMIGNGDMTQDFHTFDQRGVFPPLYENQDATGSYTRNIVAGGLSASLTF
jgi:hypothetical protein